MNSQVAQATNDESILSDTQETAIFDTVLVFGEGPIKPILFPEEVTPTQFRQLDLYNSDPLHYPEPHFVLMQHPKLLAKAKQIEEQRDCLPEDKIRQKNNLRLEWQKKGWYALKRMGRQNALAAGLALYKGITKEIIVTGGKTIGPWTKKHVSSVLLEQWPTEASLMAEVIMSSYGAMYEKKYGKKIETAIKREDQSKNTLENFAYSVNLYPQLHDTSKRIGFISADHHMKRLKLLAQLFGISVQSNFALASQNILKTANDAKTAIIDEHNCYDTHEQNRREERWIKALSTPEYITYWLGYVAEVKKAYVLQKAINKLREKAWKEAGAIALSQVQLNIDDLLTIDLESLATSNPEKYIMVIRALQQFKTPSLRYLP